jgi:hypothetical protein
MPAIFAVDQAATFRAVMFLSAAPKLGFGSDKQETAKDGTPKWQVQVVATFEQFGRMENEVLKVGITSETDPNVAMGGMPQPVQLVGFRVGVLPAEKRVDRNGNEKIVGGSAWYAADELRPLSATAPSASRKAEG